jgi:uncharacterized protein YjbI with pentapeptide repeats
MANHKHVDILLQGVKVWNSWRKKYPKIKPDLSTFSLRGAELRSVDFSKTFLENSDMRDADFTEANFQDAYLYNTDGRNAKFDRTNLTNAILQRALFQKANLRGAKLDRAVLYEASFEKADLTGASLRGADLKDAIFEESLSGEHQDGQFEPDRSQPCGADIGRSLLLAGKSHKRKFERYRLSNG